jgi:hypothetical protein
MMPCLEARYQAPDKNLLMEESFSLLFRQVFETLGSHAKCSPTPTTVKQCKQNQG